MAIPYWTAELPGPVYITNIQSVTMHSGRRVLTDNYLSGRATVYGRRPDLLPTINIGDIVTIRLYNPNSTPTSSVNYPMRVADLQIVYGTVPAMDSWTLSLEDAFAALGRSKITRTWVAGTTTSTAFDNVCTDVGISFSTTTASSPKTISATTVTAESALGVMQNIVNTEQGLLYSNGFGLMFYTRGWQTSTTFYGFGDAGGANTAYQEVQFLSMADNYATYVLVTINGGTPTVTGTGVYAYQVDSYALNATEAGYIGQYIDGSLSATSSIPNTLTVLLNTETSSRTLNAMGRNTGVTLVLRGQTYTANIIGWTVSSTTELTRVTFNLSSTQLYNTLILNNTIYGTLDYNRLGF